MVNYILKEGGYVFDPVNKTIQLNTPFDELAISQILHIKNLTTQETIYDGGIRNTVPEGKITSIQSGVIYYTIDSPFAKNTDILRIETDIGSIIYNKELYP